MMSPDEYQELVKERLAGLKAATLQWLRERFEIPDALEFPPGIPEDSEQCPVARLLKEAGYLDVFVYPPTSRSHNHIFYWLSGAAADGQGVKVRMPKEITRFPDAFDAGWYPDLIDQEWRAAMEEKAEAHQEVNR